MPSADVRLSMQSRMGSDALPMEQGRLARVVVSSICICHNVQRSQLPFILADKRDQIFLRSWWLVLILLTGGSQSLCLPCTIISVWQMQIFLVLSAERGNETHQITCECVPIIPDQKLTFTEPGPMLANVCSAHAAASRICSKRTM